MQLEMQLDTLQGYVQQAKDLDESENELKKLQNIIAQQQKSIESEQKRLSRAEEILKKEQAEWKEVYAKKQQALEGEL